MQFLFISIHVESSFLKLKICSKRYQRFVSENLMTTDWLIKERFVICQVMFE